MTAATMIGETAMAAARAPDVVIVGAGSAGAVLAMRLSKDPGRQVLLLEAGPSFKPSAYPKELTDPGHTAPEKYDWHYHSNDKATLGHDIRSARGKVVGGSSAVNGTVAMRARPNDFVRWKARGIEGWSWDEVLPVYKALENTPTGADDWHGRTGPFPIRQRSMAELTPSARGFVEAARRVGLPAVDDFNGRMAGGAGPYTLNVVDEQRMNTGMVYLTDEVRARPNLMIRSGAEVDQLVLSGKRVTGVRLVDGETVSGGEVILAGGAYGSPAILMRSGIGPSAHLKSLGIPVIADLPVGRRLQDHPFFFNVYALKPATKTMFPAAGALVWTGSSSAAPGDLDLQISATHFYDPAKTKTGGAIVLACAVTLPRSIGSFELASRDPRAAPHIRYNLFSDPSDLSRMMDLVKLSRRIGQTAPFAHTIDSEIAPGAEVTDDAALRASILANISVYDHPTSTVPMGGDGDPTAVVDAWGRVRGFEGVRVVDASIIPEAVSVPTNVTTIMIAERIAGRIVA